MVGEGGVKTSDRRAFHQFADCLASDPFIHPTLAIKCHLATERRQAKLRAHPGTQAVLRL
jgi:hypothetical protein